MKRFFTPYADKTEKKEQPLLDDNRKMPNIKTLDFLKQFARVYHVGTQKGSDLYSCILN